MRLPQNPNGAFPPTPPGVDGEGARHKGMAVRTPVHCAAGRSRSATVLLLPRALISCGSARASPWGRVAHTDALLASPVSDPPRSHYHHHTAPLTQPHRQLRHRPCRHAVASGSAAMLAHLNLHRHCASPPHNLGGGRDEGAWPSPSTTCIRYCQHQRLCPAPHGVGPA